MSDEIKSFNSLLPEIYKDSAQPTFRVAGQALGSIADLVLSPFGRCAEIAKKNVFKFLDKFDKEDQDNIVSPAPNIGVPVLQKLSYTEDEELVELYAELLKNSCLKNFKDKVLPSCVNIISNLTSDEVKLIDYLFRKKYIIYLSPDVIPGIDPEILADLEYNRIDQSKLPFSSDRLPFLEIRDQYKSKNEWKDRIRYFTDIVNRVEFQEPENIELYFENLKAMGIFEIRDDICITPLEVYDHLEKSEAILHHRATIEKQGLKMVVKKGQISFTNLGVSFLKSCTKESESVERNS